MYSVHTMCTLQTNVAIGFDGNVIHTHPLCINQMLITKANNIYKLEIAFK